MAAQFIDAPVKVSYKNICAHNRIIVVGPNNFQMCTCPQILRCRYPGRHIVAALVTQLRHGKEFDGNYLRPRSRLTLWQWSLDLADLSSYGGQEPDVYHGFTGDDNGRGGDGLGGRGDDRDSLDHAAVFAIRGRLFVNLTEMAGRVVKRVMANLYTKLTPDTALSMFSPASYSSPLAHKSSL